MTRVTSLDNPRVKEASRLVASSRDRRKFGRCVLEGVHAIDAYLARVGQPETLIVAQDAVAQPSLAAVIARTAPSRLVVVSRALLGEIATLPPDIGAIAVIVTPQAPPAVAADFCLLLEDVQDPGNVGSMLRSAAAAGVRQVHLSCDSVFAWSPKVLRAAQGAHFHLAIYEDVDLPAWSRTFRATGGTLLATVVAGGQSLFAANLPWPIALAVGNEGAGLSAALADMANRRVTIPMPGGTESLNVAVAAGICLFECVRRRESATGSCQ